MGRDPESAHVVSEQPSQAEWSLPFAASIERAAFSNR
jgi:hypothetical protein